MLSRALDTTPGALFYADAQLDLAKSVDKLTETWEQAAQYLRMKADPDSLEEAAVLERVASQVSEVIERYRAGTDLRESPSDPEKVAERGRQSIGEVPPEALQD